MHRFRRAAHRCTPCLPLYITYCNNCPFTPAKLSDIQLHTITTLGVEPRHMTIKEPRPHGPVVEALDRGHPLRI